MYFLSVYLCSDAKQQVHVFGLLGAVKLSCAKSCSGRRCPDTDWAGGDPTQILWFFVAPCAAQCIESFLTHYIQVPDLERFAMFVPFSACSSVFSYFIMYVVNILYSFADVPSVKFLCGPRRILVRSISYFVENIF